MKALIRAILIVFLLGLPVLVDAEFPKPLKEAVTREDLRKHFGTTIGFGKVEKWEFTTAGRELIVFSYCPFSGRAACYVHAYYHDRAKQAWSFSSTGYSSPRPVFPLKSRSTMSLSSKTGPERWS